MFTLAMSLCVDVMVNRTSWFESLLLVVSLHIVHPLEDTLLPLNL